MNMYKAQEIEVLANLVGLQDYRFELNTLLDDAERVRSYGAIARLQRELCHVTNRELEELAKLHAVRLELEFEQALDIYHQQLAGTPADEIDWKSLS